MASPETDKPTRISPAKPDAADMAQQEWTVHPEPDEPDTDPQAGSGRLDFESDKPTDAPGADARKHNSA